MITKAPPCAIWTRDQETGESILSIEPGWSFETETGMVTGCDIAVRLDAVGRARMIEIINAGPPSIDKLETL